MQISHIDVSTFSLAEATCSALGGKASLDDVLSVWHAIGLSLNLTTAIYNHSSFLSFSNIGLCVRTQLCMKRGVKLAAFGTFTLSTSNDPVFVLSAEMEKQCKVKQKTTVPVGNVGISALNFQQLAASCGIDREQVDKIYTKFVSCLGRSILEGRKITLSIHKVAEMLIWSGTLKCTFMNDFIFLLKTPEKILKVPDPPRVAGLASRTSRSSPVAGAASPGGRSASAPRPKTGSKSKGVIEVINRRPRERDPITGDRGSEVSFQPPPRRDRNPILQEGSETSSARSSVRPASAGRRGSSGSIVSQGSRGSLDTLSLLHSPRSQASTQLSGQGRTKGGGGASMLRKDTLERHQRALEKSSAAAKRPSSAGPAGRPGTPMDARALAGRQMAHLLLLSCIGCVSVV